METLKKDIQEGIAEKKIKITGAEAVIKCLLAEGVTLAYGYPGGAIMPVYDEIYKYQDQF
ncbi:MAG: acetolactate synthase large subunit, partial [Lutibacter sp.]|nr:acetolactate synthase large subunit [Lutibacter sp.]